MIAKVLVLNSFHLWHKINNPKDIKTKKVIKVKNLKYNEKK